MGPAALRNHCLSLPGAVEDFPFDPAMSVFKVGGRIFAWTHLDERPLVVIVKCEPGLSEMHRHAWPGDVRPAPYLGGKGWNALMIGGALPDRQVRDMIEDSYDLVAEGLPRAARARLG